MQLRTSGSVAVLLGLLSLGAGADSPVPAGSFDTARPQWTELEFSASKLLMSARASVAVELRPSAGIAGELLGTPKGEPVPPGESLLQLTYKATGLGRDSHTLLIADPVTGATLQRKQLDGGSRMRQRIYRFTDIGAYHYTRRPANAAEESQPPERWSDRSEGLRPYPQGAVGRPVTEPTALLWIAAASSLAARGDTLEVLTFSRRNVHRVMVEVTGSRRLDVDFEETGPTGMHRRRGRMDALVVRLRGIPLETPGEDAEDFELLGLRGDLELLLDPRTRAPLELRGRVKVVGALTVRLRRAVLR